MPPTEEYYPSLIDGDTDVTHALFGGAGDVNDPFGVVGEPVFYMWAAARHMWLYTYRATFDTVRVTRSGSRACAEHVVHLDYHGYKLDLPVAVVGEEAGDKLVRVRVYHSMWPLYGKHDNRAALLPADPEVTPPGPIAAYQAALAAGDVEGVLATLAGDGEDAVLREPTSAAATHAGAAALRAHYEALLGYGGLVLETCLVTDGGGACAVEYNMTSWGKYPLYPPRPGVAVYEQSAAGRITAVRVYDDLTPAG